MSGRKKDPSEIDDIVFDDNTEEAATADAVAKLQKVKAQLKACQKERQEFLDGWQRLKADAANKNKQEQERFARQKALAKESFLESLIPALDSFDAAMQGQAWKNVDDTWRMGVEYIHTQLLSALEAQGVVRFGTPGDAFDVAKHEAVEEKQGSGTPGTILHVQRAGYSIHDQVVRPARVVVAT